LAGTRQAKNRWYRRLWSSKRAALLMKKRLPEHLPDSTWGRNDIGRK
jgi:hypothetical protein